MSDEELSVGSPEDPNMHEGGSSENNDTNLNLSTNNTTAALRILRKRKNSEEDQNSETEKPLDFTNKKATTATDSSSGSTLSDHHSPSLHNSYFLPYKKLEMSTEDCHSSTSPSSKSFDQHVQAANQLKNQVQQAALLLQDANSANAAKSVKKRGVAGFSIDDILSHKTAALKEKEQQQSIVRPWDISSAGSGGGAVCSNGSGSPIAGSGGERVHGSGNGGEKHHMPNAIRNKSSSKQQQSQGDSSPLDALFQMASKTFEGLKAKSGKTCFF